MLSAWVKKDRSYLQRGAGDGEDEVTTSVDTQLENNKERECGIGVEVGGGAKCTKCRQRVK